MTLEKPQMSTGKKWLIGCGGCLSVLFILSIIIVVALQMGWNTLQSTSKSSAEAIFGPGYQSEEYTAISIPLNQEYIKQTVILIDKKSQHAYFATEMVLSDQEAAVVQQGNRQQLETILQSLYQNSIQIQKFQFNKFKTARLKNGKTVSVSHSTLGVKRRGESLNYVPVVTALFLKPEKHLVILACLSMKPNSTSHDPQNNFEHVQQALHDNLIYMIEDSVLDEHLVSNTQAEPKP